MPWLSFNLNASAVAAPRDFRDLASRNIDIERSVAPDAMLLAFPGDRVTISRQRDLESALIIGCEFLDVLVALLTTNVVSLTA